MSGASREKGGERTVFASQGSMVHHSKCHMTFIISDIKFKEFTYFFL